MIGQPITLSSGAVLRNRIVKSALSEALGDAFNDPTDGLISLYELWGHSGAALLITGNIPVDRWHLEHAANLVIDDQTFIERVRKLVSAAKNDGSAVMAQLTHAGRQTPEAINPHPLSISNVRLDLRGYGKPKIATEHELHMVIGKFARSAGLAKDAGFDGVQIHAAHGYLLSSSLSPRINTRTDRWGGSLENRARLVRTIVREVRSTVGPDFIVAVKLNSSDFQTGGFSHEDSIKVAIMLQNDGIDFLEVSGGNFEAPVAYQYSGMKHSTALREAYFLDFARDIKAALRIPVMVTGGFRSLDAMNDALTSGATDLIGIGRPFIIDPNFPWKLLDRSIDMAPAIERNFPAADKLPKGAVLNWFCHQLAILGMKGEVDLSVPIIEGHERYLAGIRSATDYILRTRKAERP